MLKKEGGGKEYFSAVNQRKVLTFSLEKYDESCCTSREQLLANSIAVPEAFIREFSPFVAILNATCSTSSVCSALCNKRMLHIHVHWMFKRS